jgi:hypothetical protein
MWEHFTLDLYLFLRACRLYSAGNYLNSVYSEKILKQKFLRNKTHNLYPKPFTIIRNSFYIIQQIKAKAEEWIVKMKIYWAPGLFVCFPGLPRQAMGVLKPAGLFYRPLWTFQLWPPDSPRLPTRSAL